jgi:hypothetical protein
MAITRRLIRWPAIPLSGAQWSQLVHRRRPLLRGRPASAPLLPLPQPLRRAKIGGGRNQRIHTIEEEGKKRLAATEARQGDLVGGQSRLAREEAAGRGW